MCVREEVGDFRRGSGTGDGCGVGREDGRTSHTRQCMDFFSRCVSILRVGIRPRVLVEGEGGVRAMTATVNH